MRALFPVRGTAVFLMLAAVGCGSDKGTEVTGPPEITLSLLPQNPSIPAAGSSVILATVGRSGGYAGPVTVTLTGGFPGMTAVVSDMQTTGTHTTALITISLASGLQLTPHALEAHATGDGVTEKTVPMILTVTPSEQPGFGVGFFNTAGTVAQGASTVIPISVFRNHYTGPVFLTVENLPSGVTTQFNPASPLVPPLGEATSLTLAVASTALPGTYNLRLRAVADGASHLPDTVLDFTLTVSATP